MGGNVGTYIDRNGCAQKFQADGTPLGLECFSGTTSGGATGTVTPVQTTPIVASAALTTTLTPESSFKYANSDTVYYLTRANCKEMYMSMATLNAWKLAMVNVLTVADSLKYQTCVPNFVRLPDNTIVTPDGVSMYLIRVGYKYPFSNYEVFTRQGYAVSQAVTLPQAEINAYPTGSTIF